MNRSHLAVLATVGLIAFGQLSAAQAQSPGNGRHTTVLFGDLNIHSQQGAQVLLGRLTMAARSVCGPEPMFFDLSLRQFYNACRKNALDDAVAAVGSPELVEAYRGNTVTVDTRTAQN